MPEQQKVERRRIATTWRQGDEPEIENLVELHIGTNQLSEAIRQTLRVGIRTMQNGSKESVLAQLAKLESRMDRFESHLLERIGNESQALLDAIQAIQSEQVPQASQRDENAEAGVSVESLPGSVLKNLRGLAGK